MKQVTVNSEGQIVLPKEVCEAFAVSPGDRLIVARSCVGVGLTLYKPAELRAYLERLRAFVEEGAGA